MHPDKKVGLALAILLIGITGAFFFRNESPDTQVRALELTDPDRIDDRIRQKTSTPTPYLPDRKSIQGTDGIAGTVADASAADVLPAVSAFDSATTTATLPDPIRSGTGNSAVPIPATDLAGAPAVGTSASAPRQAAPASKPAAVTSYEVVPGDTLSGIANRFMGSHRHFLKLYEANRDVLASPDDLRVGMKLKIPPVDGTSESASLPANGTTAGALSSDQPSAVETSPVPLPPEKSAPSFVPPRGNPRLPGRRAAEPAGRPLSQAPPPDVPAIEGLDSSGQAAVIASRDLDEEVPRSERSTDVPLPRDE